MYFCPYLVKYLAEKESVFSISCWYL